MNNKIITYSFCESYIDNLINYVDENYLKKGKDLSRLAICFGGKRPALFIKRELAKRLGKSFYPPRFFTIDEFIRYTVNKHEPFAGTEDLNSCYLLYNLVKKKSPHILKGRETFAQFLPWTREILAFIDQLDLENVDEKALSGIESNARIGYAVPDDINKLLELTRILREFYHKELHDNKTYSRGLQYLKASQVIKDVEFEEFDQILFCNFFYFHKTEEMIIKNLYERDKATLIFQGDQRKWPILERISRKFDCAIVEGETYEVPKFKLNLHAGFDAHSQVGLAREILKKIGKLDNTVVVLPNPDNIIPLLSEIASLVKDFNISMGYPLKRSSLYTLFDFIFKAQLSKKEDRYYSKDYLKLLRHPFIKNLDLSGDTTVTRILVHKIEEILTGKIKTSESGNLFIHLEDIEKLDDLYDLTREMLARLNIDVSKKDLQKMLQQIHELMFYSWERVEHFKGFARILEHSLDVLMNKSSLKNYPLNFNIATKMFAIKEELANVSFCQDPFPKEEIFRIFESKVSREIVAFAGSPLKGLQVLGLLETRSLNFENVVILDVNEGSLPKLSVYEPLIPREVMISLNLDRLELEEEIQRYQFMRLISSAKNVHLVYQQSKDKEKSRFVEELIWEEQKKAGAQHAASALQTLDVSEASFEVQVGPKQKVYAKTPEMIEALKNHVYSASSINTYLHNPMEFYYSYVLRLREKEDLLDEPQARHVGTFVHELLEEAFTPFVGKRPSIDQAFRKRFAKTFETKFARDFGRSMKTDSFLLKSVLTERLARFLDNEQHGESRQVDKILYLEQRFADTISLKCGDVKFGYIVDRVDQLKDGTIMIVDYKTGSTDIFPKAIEYINAMELSRESIRDSVKSFQIPLYFHYLDKQFKDVPINAALYNLRTLELHRFIKDQSECHREQINKVFLEALNFVVAEILDPNVPFIEERDV